jgi:Domain of unknown function (DUF4160)
MRFGSFRLVIYPNDHRPAHVHVIGTDCEAVFKLNGPGGPVTLRENFGCSRRAIAVIKDVLNSNIERFCEEWERIHGQSY